MGLSEEGRIMVSSTNEDIQVESEGGISEAYIPKGLEPLRNNEE